MSLTFVSRKRKKTDTKYIALGLIVTIIIAVLAFAIATQSSNNLAPGITDQIRFDGSVVANSSQTVQSLTSPSFQLRQNETIVIATHSDLSGTNVTSVTDSLNNVYTFQIREGSSISEGWLDIWSTVYSGSPTSDIVTVTWGTADANMFEVSVYRNAKGIGAVNGTSNQSASINTLSTTLTTTKTGSWIAGAGGTNQLGGLTFCQDLGVSSNFIQRINSCSGFPALSSPIELTMADNATTLPVSQKITFTVFTKSLNNIPIDMAEFELLPTDSEPTQIDTDTGCQSSGDTCHINLAFRATGPNSIANIVVGTAYCTGITTSLLVISSASTVQLLGVYSGQSRNDTGAILLVEAYVSTNAPSTLFGAGLCATGGGIADIGKIYFATSGATLTAYGLNEYPVSVNALASCVASCYAWFEIIPQSVGAGNLGSTIQYAQWGAANHSSLSIMQIK